MSKYLTLVLIAIFFPALVFCQSELPYKPYLLAGFLKNPQITKSDSYVIFQEEVPGQEVERDIVLTDIDRSIHYTLTNDHKSSFCSTYPNSAVETTGNWVMYYSFRYNKNGIYIQNIWTGEIRTVTQNADPYFLCSWSPDGKNILYAEDSGNINAPTFIVKVYNINTGNSVDYELTKKDEETIVRGYSNPTWSPDSKSIFYHTYLIKGGDYIFQYEFASKTLTKLIKGSNPFICKSNGEILYLENDAVFGYDLNTSSSRIIFNSFPVTKDESSFFMSGKNGNHLLVSAVVGKFSTGNDRKDLFIINLSTLAVSELKLKEKSAVNFIKLNGEKVAFQVKGWVTKGRSSGIYLENKLFTCDLSGNNMQLVIQAD